MPDDPRVGRLPPNDRLDLGLVIRLTFGAIGRNAAGIFALSLAVSALNAGLSHAAGRALAGVLPQTAVTLVGSLIGFVAQGFLSCVLTGVVLGDLDGRRTGIGAALRVGAPTVAKVIALSLVYGIAVALGAVLLVVPGLMVLVRWLVVAPAQVVEGGGLSESLSRSSELTGGNRWRIFALVLAYGVLISLLATGLVLLFGDTSDESRPGLGVDLLLLLLPEVIVSTVTAAIGSAGTAVIYAELRRIKEGAMPSRLAAVFE